MKEKKEVKEKKRLPKKPIQIYVRHMDSKVSTFDVYTTTKIKKVFEMICDVLGCHKPPPGLKLVYKHNQLGDKGSLSDYGVEDETELRLTFGVTRKAAPKKFAKPDDPRILKGALAEEDEEGLVVVEGSLDVGSDSNSGQGASWTCPECKFVNTSGNRLVNTSGNTCAACESERPAPEKAEEKGVHGDEDEDEDDEDEEEANVVMHRIQTKSIGGFRPAPNGISEALMGSWCCMRCLEINKILNERCSNCSARLPKNGHSIPKDDGTWTCKACTVANAGENQKCVMCRTEKPQGYVSDLWFTELESLDGPSVNRRGDSYFDLKKYHVAVTCYSAAVEKKCLDACYNLGFCTFHGWGTAVDKQKAAKHLQDAVRPRLHVVISPIVAERRLHELILDYVTF